MRPTSLLLPTVLLAAPLAAQETRFTRDMAAGTSLEISNINGEIALTQGTGRSMQVIVTKTVKRGDGDRFKAVLEESDGTVRVCTIDLDNTPDRTTCSGKSRDRARSGRDTRDDQVELRYEVVVPAGVQITATTVNGDVSGRGLTHALALTTVNGSIEFTGPSVLTLTTVNGSIDASLSSTRWTGAVAMQTVNGSVTVKLPANAAVSIEGQTVSGAISSDFSEVSGSGRFVAHSLRGQIGGGGRSMHLQTVTGNLNVVKK